MLKRFRYHIAVFFSVIGPGFITAVVDNDAGGIFTYSQAGAKYGYLPLWTLLPITLLLLASMWVQTAFPDRVVLRTALWLTAAWQGVTSRAWPA